MRKTLLLLLLLILSLHGVCQYGFTSVYVVAHPDQWQLFMGLNAYNDLIQDDGTAANRVVFIYVNAGDKSCNGTPFNAPNCKARQKATHTAVAFCADKYHDHAQLQQHYTQVFGHNIEQYTYNNVTSYFLQLPDGCNGHNACGQSLQQLHNGTRSSITTVDSSTTYKDWNDLARTVRQIIAMECDSTHYLIVNTADTDRITNIRDDPDRILAGVLCMHAIDSVPHLTMNLYLEDIISSLPPNLDDVSIAIKAALLSQFDFGATSGGLPSEWTPQNLNYISRNYLRTITR